MLAPPGQAAGKRRLHAPHMRPAPVHATTRRTAPNRSGQVVRVRRENRADVAGAHVLQRRIAQKAAHKQMARPAEPERVDDFEQLPQRHSLADREGTRGAQGVKEVPVSRQQHALVARGAFDDFTIGRLDRQLERVDADDAKPTGESAEHGVREKTRRVGIAAIHA